MTGLNHNLAIHRGVSSRYLGGERSEKLTNDLQRYKEMIQTNVLSIKELISISNKIFASNYNPKEQTLQKDKIDNLKIQLDKYISSIRSEILQKKQYQMNPSDYFTIATESINPYFETNQIIADLLVTKLNEYKKKDEEELYLLLILLVIVFSITTFLQITIGRSITHVLHDSIINIKEIAEGDGDLTKKFDDTSLDEIGVLMKWMNKFIENLKNIIAKINNNSGQLTHQSDRIEEMVKHYSTTSQNQRPQLNKHRLP